MGVKEVRSGDYLVHVLNDGDGILYKVVEDLVNPVRMVKTLSDQEVKDMHKKYQEGKQQ